MADLFISPHEIQENKCLTSSRSMTFLLLAESWDKEDYIDTWKYPSMSYIPNCNLPMVLNYGFQDCQNAGSQARLQYVSVEVPINATN